MSQVVKSVLLVVLCEVQAWVIDKMTLAAVEARTFANTVQVH